MGQSAAAEKEQPCLPSNKWNLVRSSLLDRSVHPGHWSKQMNGLIYLIGLIVVVMAILSFFGLR
jgi:hypothetical protein